MDKTLSTEIATLEKLYTTTVEFLVNYSFQIIGAILIIMIGVFASKYLAASTLRLCEKKNIDITIRTYLSHIVRLMVLFCFIIVALGKFGISIAPFVAALGAIALGAGLAVQGLVSNYGAGISIIITRPFKVGDTITIQGASGLVKEIRLAATIIETEDLEQILIPNKHIIGEILLNSFDYKLVETIIGISYHDKPEEAVNTIKNCLARLDFITDEPTPQVGIERFGDSAIEIGIRFWVPTNRFFESKYQANQAIFSAIKAADITIPYPQLDLHTSQTL